MAKRLRCIHAGVHRRGEKMLRGFMAQNDRFVPMALVDASGDLAKQQAALAGVSEQSCFGSLEEAIEAVQADACVITSPARFHGQQIALCLNKGLHVFVAKPMSYDIKESIALVELAERCNRFLLVDQQQQFYKTERTLAEWVRDERYGKVGFCSFVIHRHRPEMAAFTGKDPFIWEQGVHSFNSLVAILGRPAISALAVQSKPFWSPYNGATVSMGVIEFAGGVQCHYLGTFASQSFTMEIRVEFERGAARIVAEDSWLKKLEFAEPGKGFKPTGIEDDPKESLEAPNLEAFYNGATTGSRQSNDGRDNLRTLAIADAFIRASETGCKQPVQSF